MTHFHKPSLRWAWVRVTCPEGAPDLHPVLLLPAPHSHRSPLSPLANWPIAPILKSVLLWETCCRKKLLGKGLLQAAPGREGWQAGPERCGRGRLCEYHRQKSTRPCHAGDKVSQHLALDSFLTSHHTTIFGARHIVVANSKWKCHVCGILAVSWPQTYAVGGPEMGLIEQLAIPRALILDSLQTQVDLLTSLLHTQFRFERDLVNWEPWNILKWLIRLHTYSKGGLLQDSAYISCSRQITIQPSKADNKWIFFICIHNKV